MRISFTINLKHPVITLAVWRNGLIVWYNVRHECWFQHTNASLIIFIELFLWYRSTLGFYLELIANIMNENCLQFSFFSMKFLLNACVRKINNEVILSIDCIDNKFIDMIHNE